MLGRSEFFPAQSSRGWGALWHRKAGIGPSPCRPVFLGPVPRGSSVFCCERALRAMIWWERWDLLAQETLGDGGPGLPPDLDAHT